LAESNHDAAGVNRAGGRTLEAAFWRASLTGQSGTQA
jgi:hypothetical protein